MNFNLSSNLFHNMEKYYHPYYVNYFTTDNGRIYSSKTGRELKGTKTKNGYKKISIRPKGQKPINIPSHVFIWEAYDKQETDLYYK